MTARRWVLVGTAVLVAVVAVVLLVVQWDTANKIATGLSALAGAAAVGVAVWAGWPAAGRSGSRLRVSKTGRATSTSGGRANTGLVGDAGAFPDQVIVECTGDAKASGDGEANSGVQLS